MADTQPTGRLSTPPDTLETAEDTHQVQEQEPSSKRRKKDPSDRTRVSRACDRCKRKKTRCSGTQPCTLCVNIGNASTCEFTAAYTRGRPPSVPPAPLPSDPLLETAVLQNHVYDHPMQPSADMTHLRLNISDNIDSRVQSSRNSPEPSQTDLQGHYVGPSSGVSFLLRVQKKLHQTVSFSQESSIFTFGDAPLPEFNASFFVLPPVADAQALVARYFDFGAATHRFLHRPTVEAWLEEFYENLGQMKQKGAREKTALLFMVFATAKEYSPDARDTGSVGTSARYFQAADHQLSTETGEIRLTSVQARLCQCFYLLSQSRVNHCWSLFGTTARLILALGIHRKRRAETNGIDFIEFECRKRVFWCAYGLDSYLSAALGRPRTFHDEDIDQELPARVDDSCLTAQKILPQNTKAQSIMLGAVAHNTLAKIISQILRDLYSIRPPSLTTRVALTAKFSQDLLDWRKELTRFLDADSFYISLLIPLFQRQRNVLNLAYYHALILVHRPFLLSNFASLNSRGRSRGAPGTADMERNVLECLNAAMQIAAIVNELHEGQQIFRAFWFTHYFAFCAVVVLYVYTIQQRNSPKETYRAYFEVAEKCQAQIASMADKESLVKRYSVVLEELRTEAVKQTQGAAQYASGVNLQEQHIMGSMVEAFPNSETKLLDEGHGTTPSSLMAEMTGWGEFDSLVTAGMGLDFAFMGDDHTATWNRDMHGVGILPP